MTNYDSNKGEMKKILAERAKMVENFLGSSAKIFAGAPQRLALSMHYSLEAGGKRLRPVLCLSCAALCGLDMLKVMPFAAAIEMIHTYSLIHDDLPAMDNDDLRRGKPSNHKAFDEATAILAGDGLLTDAFALMAQTDLGADVVLSAIHAMAMAAGSAGMAGGQMLDMEYTGKENITLDQVELMQKLKTGAILEASCVCGAILAGAEKTVLQNIREYGRALGKAFQIADDILDVTASTEVLGKPAHSDEEEGKNTYPSLIGLDKSREIAIGEANKAIAVLASFTGSEAEFLKALALYTVQRAA